MSIVSGLFMTLTGYRTICGGIRGGFDSEARRLVGGISVVVFFGVCSLSLLYFVA